MSAAAVERTRRSLARIDARDGALRSCLLVRREALAEAASVDPAAPLAGWTIAVKDNTDVAGTVTTDGLAPPHPAPAAADATAVRRLRAAGAVIVAKANLEQLSFGATTQNQAWGSCRNPWDRDRIPGGSSGGSAVAVAAGLVDAALGTDTGGSLRNPASFCGVSALRPTHGLVPVAGITPLSPSMDVAGPLARRVADLRALMAVLAPGAGASAERPPLAGPADGAGAAAAASLDGLVVGVPEAWFLDELEPGVARSFDALLELLHAHGARLQSLALPGVADVPEAMAALQNSEAARSLRPWWDDARLEDGIRDRLELGRAVDDRQLARAERVAAAWRRTVDAAFQQVAVIATPATPFTAPLIAADDLVALSRRINRCTGVWPLLGVPALSLPLALSPQRLPVGGQLVGARGDDDRLLAIGAAIQAVSDWHLQTPPA